jgi:hypothetical protein
MTDDRGWGEDRTLNAGGRWIKKPKHYPVPDYCKCNKGHTLVEVYNEKTNAYDWDCPICINKMKKIREEAERKKEIRRSMATEVALSDTLDIDSETEVWT